MNCTLTCVECCGKHDLYKCGGRNVLTHPGRPSEEGLNWKSVEYEVITLTLEYLSALIKQAGQFE